VSVEGFVENVLVNVEGFSGAFGERWIRIVKLDVFVSMASNIDAMRLENCFRAWMIPRVKFFSFLGIREGFQTSGVLQVSA